jgi:dTMP kinase
MKYIAFEGIDGSGKSTQYEAEVDRLKGLFGEDAVKEYLYSSKDNPIGRFIKRAYSQGSSHPLSFLTRNRSVQEALYAFNARHNLRKAGVAEGDLVVSDRSIVTAYASHVDRVPDWVLNLLEPRFSPDLAIFIDIPPEVGFSRIADRETLLKEEELEALQEFYEGYKKVFEGRMPPSLRNTQIEVIDGTRPIEAVTSDVIAVVDPWLEKNYRNNGRAR